MKGRSALPAAAIAIAALAAFAPAAGAVFPGENGRIAFVTAYWQDCGECGPEGATVWTAASRRQPVRLASGWQAHFSPAGSWIAYHSRGVWIAHRDGSDRRRVAGAGDYTSIAWSSRGALALAGNGAVSVLRAVGGKVQRLPAAAGATEVVWNPAGTTLGFSSPGAVGPVISTVGRDGTGLRVLGEGDQPDWSAEGWLSFRRNGGLVVTRPGKPARVLTRGLGVPDLDDPWFAKSYSWSPNGRQVAIARNGAIYVVAASGGEPRRLTRPEKRAFAYAPVWSPDGRLIAYVRGRRILVVPARGGRSRVFTSFRLDSRCNPSDGCYDWVASLDWQARRP